MAIEYKRIDVDSHIQEMADTWTSRASMPGGTGVYLPGSASIGGRLWIFGGIIGSGPDFGTTTSATWLYDPTSNSWAILG